MDNYTTNQPRTGRENERPTSLETLGGEFGLSWNDTVPLTTGAHNAFLSAFFEAGGVFDFRRNSELPAQDHFCVAVEGRSTLAAHHLLGLQEIQAHLQALPASPGRPNHAATGLIRRQTNHKAVEIDRRERGGRFQLLYLG